MFNARLLYMCRFRMYERVVISGWLHLAIKNSLWDQKQEELRPLVRDYVRRDKYGWRTEEGVDMRRYQVMEIDACYGRGGKGGVVEAWVPYFRETRTVNDWCRNW
ncbi:hypothetical protein BJ508DRAFT_310241 [Ascobolus immersus RN42]|uniref:Uncharacterized protein n=1 Tax=Ascobolus immersus RN42 TaxID=1160509 RepID=A0A3N4HW42_ASCIM|nr:hypothetical protein BJ508DRAFT_310241 [Ascobolus immersus RN42]